MSINFDVPETGRSPFSGSWLPADLGFKAMTSDPGTTISGLTLAAGQINAFRIRLLKPETLTGVVVGVQTAGIVLQFMVYMQKVLQGLVTFLHKQVNIRYLLNLMD